MIRVYTASAFSKDNQGGNKAGVVLNGSELSYNQKQKVAKELGYSETVFVSDSCMADFKLQYFTPTDEVPICGHATIATFSTLKLCNMVEKQHYTIETNAGILNIQIKEDGLVFMEQNRPAYLDVLSSDILMNCVENDFIANDLPIQIVSTGLHDIMLPIDSLDHLKALSPNFDAMAKVSKQKKVVGVHAFTLIKDPNITAICRNFAPLYGINEESATGTSNCALACYLFKYHRKQSQYIFEQGHQLGEVSQIIVNVSYHGDEIDSVSVGGYGYLIDDITLSI